MKRNLRLVLMLFRLKLSRAMMFRLSFFGSLFVDGSLFGIQILMFDAIYGHVDSVAGWDRGQALLFVGIFSLINALNMVLFFFGVNSLDRKIRSGELDGYLTKPFHPLLRISLENIDLGSLPLVALSAVIIGIAAPMVAGITPLRILACALWTLLMLLLWYDMMVILRSIAFFTVSAAAIDPLEGMLITMCMRIPGTAFKGVWKLIFCVLLPYGLMGTLPVQALVGALSPMGMLLALLVVAAFTFLALSLFRLGVRNYKSSGS